MAPPFPAFQFFKSERPVPHVDQTTLNHRVLVVRKPTTSKLATIPSTKLKSLKPAIKASDVPQWLWSRDECCAWLYQVAIHYFNWSPETAKFKSEQLEGFGPMLYLKMEAEWRQFLGDWAGISIYALLLSVRHCEGAVPDNVFIGHGEQSLQEQ